jgi:hypothetical protein
MPDRDDHLIPAPAGPPSAGGPAVTPRVSWPRRIIALLIALAADTPPLCLLGESVPVLLDVAVAAALWLVLGRSRLLAMALLVECIPGVGLAPTWTLYVVWEIIGGTAGKSSPASGRAPQ